MALHVISCFCTTMLKAEAWISIVLFLKKDTQDQPQQLVQRHFIDESFDVKNINVSFISMTSFY